MREELANLNSIVGADRLFPQPLQWIIIPLDENGVEIANPRAPRTDAKALKANVVLEKIGAIPAKTRNAVSGLAERMPEVREWILSSVTSDFADAVRSHGFRHAFTEVRYYEDLNLGFDFRGEPVMRFRGSFTVPEMKRLGIEARPTTGTLGLAKPTTQTLEMGSRERPTTETITKNTN
jgi:hypothetical protein